MVMLPADWEVRKARPVSKLIPSSYMSLLGVRIQSFFFFSLFFLLNKSLNFFFIQMVYDITILLEVLNGFARLNFELENKAQIVDARTEVAGELLHAAEEWEKKYQEKLAKLEAELGIS